VSLAVALETSTRRGSVAVAAAGEVSEAELAAPGSHATDLLPALDRLFGERGLEKSAITDVYVGLGPGSYTGLRIGVATALGLARAAGARVSGVASVEALAFGALRPGEEGTFLLDARAGELYFAVYAREAAGVRALVEPCTLPPAELGARLPRRGVLFVDAALRETLALPAGADLRLDSGTVPRARWVLDLGARRREERGPGRAPAGEPLYLRPFVPPAARRP
jgi:tRNA threonylcarbamoyladenosine biosynthesis protein TsaB